MVQVLERDASVLVQGEALAALYQDRKCVPPDLVTRFLDAEEPQLRQAAVQWLRPGDQPEAKAKLEHMLITDMPPALGYQLVKTLAAYGGLSPRPLFSNANPGVRRAAIEMLSRENLEDVQLLLRLADTEADPLCRFHIATKLCDWHLPRAIPLLLEIWDWQQGTADRCRNDQEWKAPKRSIWLQRVESGIAGDCEGRARSLMEKVTVPFPRDGENPYGENFHSVWSRFYRQWWEKNADCLTWRDQEHRFACGH